MFRRAKMNLKRTIFLAISIVILLQFTSISYCLDIEFKINPDKDNHPISPVVYGANQGNVKECPLRRSGGNRMTGYNWENNASSAGSDWQHYNDFWLCGGISSEDCEKPGFLMEKFVKDVKANRAKPLITIQMAGYVAADGNQAVSEAETAPSKRWCKIVVRKGEPFSLKPDLTDGVVYMDEFINFLVHKFGKSGKGGVEYYNLDNEPALWPGTHPRIHPKKVTYEELVKKSAEMADMILDMDPNAKIVGAVLYGYFAYAQLQDAPDAKKYKDKYPTFADYYLAEMKKASDKAGKRLLHYFDLHWYPEAQGTDRICFQSDPAIMNKTENVKARLQAPRSFWDPEYMENSWIVNDFYEKPINLFNDIQSKIDKHFPGTKIACTEYNFGATDFISGGIAQADVLGIFGKYDVLGAKWGGDGDGTYTDTAFRLYLNYDYKGSKFEDTSCFTETSDIENSSVYAAKNSKNPNKMTLVVLNKNLKESIKGKFSIELKSGEISSLEVYRFDEESTDIKALYKPVSFGYGTDLAEARKRMAKMMKFTPKIEGKTFEYDLPALTATLFVVKLSQ